MISIEQEKLHDFDYVGKTEWLETNGLGGYSSSTISNCHSRRYHGLLVAATQIPTGRTVLVSKMDEALIIGENRIDLATNNYNGTVTPRGYQYLEKFSKEFYPEWIYKVEDTIIKKSLIQLRGKNTTLIKYNCIHAKENAQLQLKPFIIARDYHSISKMNYNLHWDATYHNGTFHNNPYGDELNIYIRIPGAQYHHHPEWFYNFLYQEELNRGQEYLEDLLCFGEFIIPIKTGDTFYIALSTENPENLAFEDAFNGEVNRRSALIDSFPRNEITDVLVLASDQFIVKREVYLKQAGIPIEGATIIAGYHWFTDWGRDTMISLPGLCILTNRWEEAKKILWAFANSMNEGMLPNFFSDKDGLAEFNNVDGTLWFFLAVYQYLKATNDEEFVLGQILPVMEIIMDWHRKGTRYQIKVDPNDHFLFAGAKGQQLTWMDARIGDWVVTPRMGKPVEIQALWYNALCIMKELTRVAGNTEVSLEYEERAQLVQESFTNKFWFEEGQYLYDAIDENNIPITAFRPNQLFAISLPFELVKGERAKTIIGKIKANLFTPVGLRSLAPNDPNYKGWYGGTPFERDSNYHQGTVWSWLLGPYIDALVKIETPKNELIKIIKDFTYHFQEGCIGTISEIFDGDTPHAPKGCIAQAWSVGELLRVILTYQLV